MDPLLDAVDSVKQLSEERRREYGKKIDKKAAKIGQTISPSMTQEERNEILDQIEELINAKIEVLGTELIQESAERFRKRSEEALKKLEAEEEK